MKRVYNVNIRDFEIDLDYKFFASQTNHYNLKSNWEEHLNLDNKFDDSHFQNNVDLLHRFPNLSLSRDKLAIYAEKSNFKVTRNKELADIVVISNKYLEKSVEKVWCKVYNKDEMINYCDAVINNPNLDKYLYIKKNNNHLGFKKSISDAPEDSIFINAGHYWNSDKENTHHNDIIENLNKHSDRQYVNYFKDIESYKWLLDNQHKIIMDIEVNKLCTADSIKLSKEDFERMEELIGSTDTDNVSIGLTLMSNCNIKESETFISLLFAFYSEHMKRSKVWNQVNFKYLRKEFENYINITPANWGHAYNMLIKMLVKDDILTLYASRYVANKMFIGVLQNNFGIGNKDGVFKISEESLQLRPEIAEKLVNEPEEKLSELVGAGSNNGTIHDNDLPF